MQNLRFLTRIPTGMSYLLRREHNWGQPIFFTIETINTCNFRCVYCPQSDPASHFVNGQGTMSLENFKAIVANLRSAFNVGIVSLHGDGEPLLNKRLEEYIAHLTGLGVCVTVASNCSLISPDRAKRLIASGLRMMGTDFCADAALYERLRVRGKWQATLDGMHNMLQAAAEAKSDFRLVVKDFATHGLSPEQAGPIMEATRKLFPEERDRVTVMPIYFHNALGESLVNLNDSPAAKSSGCLHAVPSTLGEFHRGFQRARDRMQPRPAQRARRRQPAGAACRGDLERPAHAESAPCAGIQAPPGYQYLLQVRRALARLLLGTDGRRQDPQFLLLPSLETVTSDPLAR